MSTLIACRNTWFKSRTIPNFSQLWHNVIFSYIHEYKSSILKMANISMHISNGHYPLKSLAQMLITQKHLKKAKCVWYLSLECNCITSAMEERTVVHFNANKWYSTSLCSKSFKLCLKRWEQSDQGSTEHGITFDLLTSGMWSRCFFVVYWQVQKR